MNAPSPRDAGVCTPKSVDLRMRNVYRCISRPYGHKRNEHYPGDILRRGWIESRIPVTQTRTVLSQGEASKGRIRGICEQMGIFHCSAFGEDAPSLVQKNLPSSNESFRRRPFFQKMDARKQKHRLTKGRTASSCKEVTDLFEHVLLFSGRSVRCARSRQAVNTLRKTKKSIGLTVSY